MRARSRIAAFAVLLTLAVSVWVGRAYCQDAGTKKPEPQPWKRYRKLHALEGHTDGVGSVAFSPDGKLLASASWDKSIRIWDTRTGRCLHTLQVDPKKLASVKAPGKLPGHIGGVQAVTFSPDGKLLASGGRDNRVCLWNPQTGKCLRTLKGHTDIVSSVAFSPDGKLLATTGGYTIRIWNPTSGECTKTFEEHECYVGSLAFSPDGKLLASTSGGKVRIRDTQTGKSLQVLKAPGEFSIHSAMFSPDGQLLVTMLSGLRACLWDLKTGKAIYDKSRGYWVNSVKFSPDGRVLASVGSGGMVEIWDRRTGKRLNNLQGHTYQVWSVAFSRDGRMLASGGADNKVFIWGVPGDDSGAREGEDPKSAEDLKRAVAALAAANTELTEESCLLLLDAFASKTTGLQDAVRKVLSRLLSEAELKKVEEVVSVPAPRELIKNGDFARGLDHWKKYSGMKKGRVKTHALKGDKEKFVHWERVDAHGYGGEVGFSQELDADVSGCESLVLSVRVKVISHSLRNSGHWSTSHGGTGEYPVEVRFTYSDKNKEKQLRWAHGFLLLKNTEPFENYSAVEKGKWFNFDIDLCSEEARLKPNRNKRGDNPLLPKMTVIRDVFICGHGWDYSGQLSCVSLKAVSENPAAFWFVLQLVTCEDENKAKLYSAILKRTDKSIDVARCRKALALLPELDANDWRRREKASKEILKLGPGIRDFLEALMRCRRDELSTEARIRIHIILKKLTSGR